LLIGIPMAKKSHLLLVNDQLPYYCSVAVGTNSAISADGTVAAIAIEMLHGAENAAVIAYDTFSGAKIADIPIYGRVRPLIALSANGESLAIARGTKQTGMQHDILLKHLKTGKQLDTGKSMQVANAGAIVMDFNPDGGLLVVAYCGGWDDEYISVLPNFIQVHDTQEDGMFMCNGAGIQSA
jgi:hypothetical protein